MTCRHCHDSGYIAVEPGERLSYPCPDCDKRRQDEESENQNETDREENDHMSNEANSTPPVPDAARTILAGWVSDPRNDGSYVLHLNHPQTLDLWQEIDDALAQKDREIAELRAYADKLADGLPEGMLPKDVEVLREANHGLANERDTLRADLAEAKQEIAELRADADLHKTRLAAVIWLMGDDVLVGQVRTWADDYKRERDTLRAEVERMERWATQKLEERDRADERAATLRAQLAAAKQREEVCLKNWSADMAKLEAQLAAAQANLARKAEVIRIREAQLAAAQEDTARLDLLLHNYAYADGSSAYPRLRWGLSAHGRAAIDAARKEGGAK